MFVSQFNPFTPDCAKSKIDTFFLNYKLSNIEKQHHSKVLLNGFPRNGHL